MLWVFAVGMLAGFIMRARQKRLYDRQASMQQVRSLHWKAFEELIAEAFRREGYDVHLTPPGTDGGVDLRLKRQNQCEVVQCKQWRSHRVGVGPVRELAGVVAAEGASGGIFVCSGRYTPEAEAFAARAGIRLVDERSLAAMLRLDSAAEQRLAADDQACPQCGGRLVRRVARRGRHAGNTFLGCSTFPKCRYTRDIEFGEV